MHNDAAVHALYTHTDETAMRRAVDSLPALNGTKALPEPTDAVQGPMDALRGRIRELAGQLDCRNWKTIRSELTKAIDNMPDMA